MVDYGRRNNERVNSTAIGNVKGHSSIPVSPDPPGVFLIDNRTSPKDDKKHQSAKASNLGITKTRFPPENPHKGDPNEREFCKIQMWGYPANPARLNILSPATYAASPASRSPRCGVVVVLPRIRLRCIALFFVLSR